jgi:hypothetical protein
MDSTDSRNSAVEGTCGHGNEYFGFINHVMDFLRGKQLSASDRLYAWSASKLFNYLGRGGKGSILAQQHKMCNKVRHTT